jgi:heat shock protein HslJ
MIEQPRNYLLVENVNWIARTFFGGNQMKRNLIVIFFSLLLFSACEDQSTVEEANKVNEELDQEFVESEIPDIQPVDSELVEREWFLNSLDGKPLIEGTNIILAFDEASFSGFAGCNGYGGPLETGEDGSIKFGEMSSQAEGCIEPEGVLDQEINYLDKLRDMKQYHVDNGILTLSIREGGQSLVYSLREPFEMDPALLDDSDWNLLPSDDFSLIEGSEITISFSNGKMEGFGGCRNYQGEYEAEGDEIRFPMIMMVDEVCDDEDLLIQEGKFTTALELSIHYRVQDDRLTLFLATGETVIFERRE